MVYDGRMENIYVKNFDSWNLHKKSIHQNGVNKYYSQQEIWWCSLGTNIGFEEDGSGFVGERPVLIIRGFNRHNMFSSSIDDSA